MSNLPTDPTAPVIGRQLTICQHLWVKEIVLQQNTPEVVYNRAQPALKFLKFNLADSSGTDHFSAGDGVERSSKQLSSIYKCLHDKVCHYREQKNKYFYRFKGKWDHTFSTRDHRIWYKNHRILYQQQSQRKEFFMIKCLLLRETPAPRLWFKSKGSGDKSR